MADAIDWSNLTREQADFLRTIAPMAGTTLSAYIDGCDRRMKTSRSGERWYDEAFSEKVQWQRLHGQLRTLQNRALQIVLRPQHSSSGAVDPRVGEAPTSPLVGASTSHASRKAA